ncbi:hypothetical protein [Psychrobacter sp. ANT_WB68]|uniref:hypothetical protein n=1 Tax=Psychrobacter sp. ANT_WB68 TaxID=2597355 RepID=UPI0011F1218B|nr:hypothetical protein [Psychrobacter sp. ANT_WB68]KAA0915871.1 hypothetical protein FQ084_04890 [Psychrobacter sp. ANT_WB68]
MTKKVLIISWHFPPYKSSSAFNLFKRLKDTGYEYDVLQIRRDDKPDNEAMFRFASSCFNRYEIDMPSEDARNADARDHYVNKVIELYNVLKQKNHYSAMISHSHEIASHMAAMAIKKSSPELRWVASFGDPIAANPFNDSYQFPMLEEDSQTEAQVLQQADRIIVTNIYQQDLVIVTQAQQVDREKFFVLPHCFDERMYPSLSNQENYNNRLNNVFRFMHVGMLYKFKRTAEPFMLGAQRLLQKHPELRGCFTLEFYGANDRYIQAAADYGLVDTVSFKGTVSYLESLKVMSEADCLLLRDADFSDQGIKDTPFYPGKLADYMGAKKPILAVTMAHGCVPDMLNEIGGASLTEDDIDGITDAMYDAMQGYLSINVDKVEYYSHINTAKLAKQALTFIQDKKKVLIAGHDLKFAKFIIEALESSDDFEVLIDKWESHSKHDEKQSIELLNQADIIFCEWGLGNLVWYSNHKKQGQKLITRIHAQELKTRHLDQCNHDNIDNYIFVSPYFYELMIAEFELERKKCKMVFNMVDTELLDKPKLPNSKFHLGMIGDVPQSKRLDRALDIFEQLYQKDKRYKLFIKGKRPEEYPWMHSKAKAEEMAYYQQQYQRIKDNGWDKSVVFEGHGPIDEWLQNIGWILSVSDNESFHLSVAEGMASGAVPVILKWPGAETIYPEDCIFDSVSETIRFIYSNYSHVKTNKKYVLNFDSSNISNNILNFF